MKYTGIIFLLLSILVNGCKDRGKVQGGKVFRLNISAGVSSLDPAFSKDQPTMWMCNQLYNGLLQVDDSLNVVPAIARSYTVSGDGLVYTFFLRDDVYFHDHPLFKDGKGRRVTATDFVYSFNRITDEKVASTGAWLFNGKIADKAPFTAVNDTIFQLRLKVPFRPMAGLLTLQYCSVVPHEVVEYYGKDFRKHPVGTGPFRLVRWQENEALVLTRNPGYFEKDAEGQSLPYIDGIRISFLNDRGVEFLQFLQGGFDMVSGVDKSFRDKALTANGELRDEYKKDVVMERLPFMSTEYLGFSMAKLKNEAIRDKRVRQAVNYAIDREKMIWYLRNGIGQPAMAGMIPKGMNGYNAEIVKGYHYDPDKARELLKQAGYPGGKGLQPVTLYSNPLYQDLTDYIAKSLEEVGIKVIVQLSPGSFLREAMIKNEVDFFRASWIGDYPDSENYLALFYSGYGAPPNYTFFKNERYDRLYEQALKARTEEEAVSYYYQMDRIVIEEAPVVPLFYDELVRFTGKRVKYLPVNAMNLLVLKTAVMN